MTRSPDNLHGKDGSGANPATPPAGRPGDKAVAELMKPPVVVVPGSATVAEALRLLTSAHVAGAPVVQDEHLVGVVTLADLHRWSTETDLDLLEEPARALRSRGMRLDGLAVDRLLPRLAIAARHDWPADHALTVLARAGVQRLPVIDDRGRLVGVIARDVLLAAGARSAPSTGAEGPAPPGRGS